MKKIVLASLIGVFSIGFFSCSNGAYDANPDTNNSGTSNPLNPDPNGNNNNNNNNNNNSFNWSGTDPMSAKVDGVEWKAATVTYNDQAGIIFISGRKDENDPNSSTFTFSFQNTTIEAGKTYDFNTSNANYAVNYSEELMDLDKQYSGNIGGGKIKILESDASHVKALFYFTGKNNNTGKTVTITDGYFNVNK